MMKSESLQREKRHEKSGEIMKHEGDDIPAEVDFSHGVRGKYAGRLTRDAVYVPLESDVSAAFQTPEEVNTALRLLMKTAMAALPNRERKVSHEHGNEA